MTHPLSSAQARVLRALGDNAVLGYRDPDGTLVSALQRPGGTWRSVPYGTRGACERRGYIDASGTLTDAGRAWVAAHPEEQV